MKLIKYCIVLSLLFFIACIDNASAYVQTIVGETDISKIAGVKQKITCISEVVDYYPTHRLTCSGIDSSNNTSLVVKVNKIVSVKNNSTGGFTYVFDATTNFKYASGDMRITINLYPGKWD